ncbi:shwachman-Bodian-diamond syndrome protein [Macroventuria anomochaeta]|uniref:Shwachman-Bodian-diamond syndrome protein n=1 Tax=Macroventuria anomochaeta TaxID=301207 RepID=A0ACB6S018_9PLEO|nr:shwachman-Bodian-diamond syndrome protein [Macroventuria anomochaeta]KAF2627570.1 shwachman-Bodian-diamond syndrome protein [Macroventuria anomochaeta]
MARGDAIQTKVHYKGKAEDFIVFVDSSEAVQNWKQDSSIPLAQVVSGFKILVTDNHGTQGILNTASKGTLENEFGTSNEDEVIKQILQKGDVQSSQNSERQGDTNDSKGPMAAH